MIRTLTVSDDQLYVTYNTEFSVGDPDCRVTQTTLAPV
jgi:hypothetical protein